MHPIWDFTATHWKHLVNLHWFIAPYYSQTSLYQVYKLRESLGFSTSFFKNWILLLKQSSWPFFSFSCYFFIFSLTSVYMLSCSVYSFFLAKKKNKLFNLLVMEQLSGNTILILLQNFFMTFTWKLVFIRFKVYLHTYLVWHFWLTWQLMCLIYSLSAFWNFQKEFC